ncbi:serine/threonine-protein phosphatase 7 long form homolog [Daucus carota subsp. sativus]|uniref:serine/threonine-protein phosphatase 7 long form homolog n=1 Tax=Daucus carota subsp. sativus TaxID=79200 RepID=UPI0007EFFEB4|nr:PREDICTED: serine/threonine-protein phosphatase 7 long form homolog [Daucus carota subsp. sativus]
MDDTVDDINVDGFELKPGPSDTSVLHLQAEHRSSTTWNMGGGDVLRSRVRNPSSSRFPSLHSRMVPLLRDVGFDGVARLTSIHIDWSLVTALVERWRPETHTFHLPVGECSITLQDVSVILGLRVDGCAITGSTEFIGGWGTLVESIFGKAPAKQDLDGGRLKLNWLTNLLPVLSADANEDELIRYTQSYMLQLIGGILFTDHQGSQVHCMFLPLIQNLDRARTLSWGSGVLAYLYRELCKLWAWTRLPTLAPIPRGPYVDNREIWGDLPGPFGLR